MNVPAVVGVPLIMPVAVSTDNPATKPVAAKDVGEFVAVIEYENEAPNVPLALAGLVMAGIKLVTSPPLGGRTKKS